MKQTKSLIRFVVNYVPRKPRQEPSQTKLCKADKAFASKGPSELILMTDVKLVVVKSWKGFG